MWSAGCSTGEEPYTLAMVLQEFGESNPGFRFKILATDISNTVLAKAEKGVFGSEVIQPVPTDLRRKYFMRSRDPNLKSVRVVPELRSSIEFRRLNLMEEFGLNELMDAIFCRNVIIYFDRATQDGSFSERLSRQLVGGGYMFVWATRRALHHMDIALTGAGRSRPVQESRCPNSGTELLEIYLQPGEISISPAAPRILEDRAPDPASASPSGARAWAWAPFATPSCPGALPFRPARQPRKATAMSISRLAISPASSKHWGAIRGEVQVRLFGRC